MVEDLGIRYFSLEEYVNGIVLTSRVLEHLDYTEEEFTNYMKKLMSYNSNYILKYWIYLLYDEMTSTYRIENHSFDNVHELSLEMLSNNSEITQAKIHRLHDFAVNGDNKDGKHYRKVGVNISSFKPNGEEQIFYRGVNHNDINRFMNDFVRLYSHMDNEPIDKSSFLKSALLHLLFVRIHPYTDGNGRTARIIHNLKFTASLGKFYGIDLKLSPLNLSKSIYVNKITYVNILNSLAFDLVHDDNPVINKWFEFILNMALEQIYMSSQKLDRIDTEFLKQLDTLSKDFGYVNARNTGVKELKKLL